MASIPKPLALPSALPKAPGDPVKMAAMAASCKAAAAELSAGAQGASTALTTMAFEGRAANVLSGTVTRNSHAVTRTAQELSTFADELLAGVDPLRKQHAASEARAAYIEEVKQWNEGLKHLSAAEKEFGYTDPPSRKGR